MKRTQWTRTHLSAAVASSALAALLLAPSAQAQTVVKCGSVAPEGTPWADWLKNVRKDIESKSGNKMKLKVYLAGKLGGEKEMVEDVKRGRLQMFGGSVGALASKYVPELNVFELPFLFNSDAEVDFVLNKVRPEVEKLLDARGFKMVMWAENGWHGYGIKGKCVASPADMTGLKMRSQESSTHVDTFKAFGASPVELPVPEVLSALQTGTVDGYSNTPLFGFAISWHKGIDHFTYTKHIYQPALIVVSKKWFDTLPADQQAIVMSKDREREGINTVRKLTGPLLENYTYAKIKVCNLDDAGRKAFGAKVKPVWDNFSKKSKGNKKLLNAVLAAKKEFASK